jgi:hypothetical protein
MATVREPSPPPSPAGREAEPKMLFGAGPMCIFVGGAAVLS